MYCSKCGKQLADNAKFCAGCGTAQNTNVTPTYSTADVFKTTALNNITTNGMSPVSNLLSNIISVPAIRVIFNLIMLIFMWVKEFKVVGIQYQGEKTLESMSEIFSIRDRMTSDSFFSFHIILLLIILALSVTYLLKIKHISGKILPNIFCILVSLWMLLILAIHATDESGIMIIRYTIIVKMRLAGYIHLFATLGSIVCSILAIKKRKSWN